MNRTVNKVTPKGDLSWYVKWFGSIMVVIGLTCRSMDIYTPYDLIFSLVGTLSWVLVGMIWHDRSLIFMNTVCATILALGVIKFSLWGEF